MADSVSADKRPAAGRAAHLVAECEGGLEVILKLSKKSSVFIGPLDGQAALVWVFDYSVLGALVIASL